MRIVGTDNSGEKCFAYEKKNRLSGAVGFSCNPPGRGFHKPEHERKFLTEDEAVTFLSANNSWGIWLKASGKTGSLFFNFIIDGRPRQSPKE